MKSSNSTSNSLTRPVVAIILNTILGLAILTLLKVFPLPFWLHPSIPILLVFVGFNYGLAALFKLKEELRDFWSMDKFAYILVGTVIGALIGLFPELICLIGFDQPDGFEVDMDISFYAIGITLTVVAWEELWFRGVFLNYCRRFLSPSTISWMVGLAFMAVHALNPQVDLLVSGPTLFFAGAFLTLVYFVYETIWLPIGLHFGNNLFGSMLGVHTGDPIIFGEDGYLNALILAILYLGVLIRLRNRKRSVPREQRAQ